MPDKEEPKGEEEIKPKVEVKEEEKQTKEVEVSTEVKKEEPYQVSKDPAFQGLQNTMHGYRRVSERQDKTLKEIQASLSELKAQGPPQGPAQKAPEGEKAEPGTVEAQAEKLVNEGKWQEGVGLLAQQKAEGIVKARETELAKQAEAQKAQATLTTAKQRVIDRYPDLDPESGNEDAEVSKLYREVLNLHPEYLSNNFGPILAMHDAEDLAKERDIELKPSQPVKETQQAEKSRLVRAKQASIPASRGKVDSEKVYMTQTEIEMCKDNGIPPEQFAKIRQQLERGEEITA